MEKKLSMYSDAGVSLSKSSINVGDEVVVSYDGLLVKSGADTIIMHYGYGDTWENRDFIRMDNKEGIFSAEIKAVTSGSLNISFKDSANNWDNNSAQNYSFKVSKKEKADAEPKEPSKVKKAAEKSPEKSTAKTEAVKTPAKTAAPKKAAEKTKTAVEKKKL